MLENVTFPGVCMRTVGSFCFLFFTQCDVSRDRMLIRFVKKSEKGLLCLTASRWGTTLAEIKVSLVKPVRKPWMKGIVSPK